MKWLALFLAVAMAGCSGGPAGPEAPLAGQEADAEGDHEDPAKGRTVDLLNQTVVTKIYTGYGVGPFAINTGCGGIFFDPGGPENIGGACFALPSGTERIEFEVEDDVSGSVPLYIRYEDDTAGFACTEGRLSPPATAWVMFVIWETGCVGQVPPATPTSGEIKVTMHHP